MAILEYLLENADMDDMRNTLTRLYEKLRPYFATSESKMSGRSTLHKYLKNLMERGILIEEIDNITSVNNQPMRVVRYSIASKNAAFARQLVVDARSAPDRL